MAATFISSSSQKATLSSSLSVLQNLPGASICAWVKPSAFQTTERWILFFSVNGSTTSSRLSISIRPSGSNFRVNSRRLDVDGTTSLDSIGSVSTGTLYHVCAVAEWTNQILRLYINGVQNNSVAVAGWTANCSNTASTAATIGGRSAEYIDATLDDLRAYNRVLTPNEVANIFGARGRDTVVNGMVERWKLMNASIGSSMGTSPSIGSNQGGAVGSNSPLIAASLSTVTRARRH